MKTERVLDLLRRVIAFMGTLPPGIDFVRTHGWGCGVLGVVPVSVACATVAVRRDVFLFAWPPGKRSAVFALGAIGTLGMLPIYASFVERSQPTWINLMVGASSIGVLAVISTRFAVLIGQELRLRRDRGR